MAFSEKAASPTSSGNRLSSASVLYQIDITIDPEMLAARAPLASGAGSDRCLYTQAIIMPNIALMQAGNENRM
jgi:hypothetical protein